jgi:putative methionine-R-sulfoxide reductase with GAF domain
VLGVLDIDSPRYGRFTAADQQALETLAALYVESVGAVEANAA